MTNCDNISGQLRNASKYPGVAKFGIALEWGSRGRWFESSHSDQNSGIRFCGFQNFYWGESISFRKHPVGMWGERNSVRYLKPNNYTRTRKPTRFYKSVFPIYSYLHPCASKEFVFSTDPQSCCASMQNMETRPAIAAIGRVNCCIGKSLCKIIAERQLVLDVLIILRYNIRKSV